jgi:hypothetical protein
LTFGVVVGGPSPSYIITSLEVNRLNLDSVCVGDHSSCRRCFLSLWFSSSPPEDAAGPTFANPTEWERERELETIWTWCCADLLIGSQLQKRRDRLPPLCWKLIWFEWIIPLANVTLLDKIPVCYCKLLVSVCVCACVFLRLFLLFCFLYIHNFLLSTDGWSDYHGTGRKMAVT